MPQPWICASASAAPCHGLTPHEPTAPRRRNGLQISIGGQLGLARSKTAKVALFHTATNTSVYQAYRDRLAHVVEFASDYYRMVNKLNMAVGLNAYHHNTTEIQRLGKE